MGDEIPFATAKLSPDQKDVTFGDGYYNNNNNNNNNGLKLEPITVLAHSSIPDDIPVAQATNLCNSNNNDSHNNNNNNGTTTTTTSTPPIMPNIAKMKIKRKRKTVVAGVLGGVVGLVLAGPILGVATGV